MFQIGSKFLKIDDAVRVLGKCKNPSKQKLTRRC